MTSQTGKQTIAVHIFFNVSKSKDNQTMKSGQLIKYNMRNVSWKIEVKHVSNL